MLLVLRDRVGPTAFARLVRDGLVHEVIGGVALPADIPSTRAMRAHMLEPFVPSHTWLTGLAALWLEGFGGPPSVLDVAGPRGVHRTVPATGSPPIVFHSGWRDGLPGLPGPLPVRVATITRACIDALSQSPAVTALPAVAKALRAGRTTVTDLVDAVGRIERHTHYRARLESLVDAIGVSQPG